MKVLQVINNLDVGGAETLLKNYIINNEDSTIENDVCTLVESRNFIVDEFKNRGIKLYELNLKNKYLFLSAIHKINNLIKENNYDVVHMHLFPAQYYAYFLSKLNKEIPFIFFEHSDYNSRRDKKIFYTLEKKSYRSFKRVLCISKMTKNSLDRFIPGISERTEVMYGGINVPKTKVNAKKEYDIALVGSLRSEVKGVDILLRAIADIKDEIGKVVILGDGILKDELIKIRDDLGIRDKVEFKGNVSDVNFYLQKCKIFCLPSRWEGFGLAILEAMSNSIPVIATNVGGIPEIILNEEDGILIESENHEALANKIKELLKDESKREFLGNNAYNKVKDQFSIESYVDRLNNFYKSIKAK